MSSRKHIIRVASHGRPRAHHLLWLLLFFNSDCRYGRFEERARKSAEVPVSTVAVVSFRKEFEGRRLGKNAPRPSFLPPASAIALRTWPAPEPRTNSTLMLPALPRN